MLIMCVLVVHAFLTSYTMIALLFESVNVKLVIGDDE